MKKFCTLASQPLRAKRQLITLGLAFTRLRQSGEALAEFRTATASEPRSARYADVYAVAMHSEGSAMKP